MPPFAVRVVEYAELTRPSGKDVVVICNGVTPAATTMLKFFVALCAGELESVTFTVNEAVPELVGVPLI